MDYSILAAELQLSQYAGMSDAEIVAALNDPGPSTRQRVSIERLQATAMEISVYVALRTAIATPTTPPQVLALCQSALDLVNARFYDIDLDNPAAQSMFGTLQQAGIINAQQAAAIDVLATVPGTSRAQALGLGSVDEQDIGAAREWQAQQDAERERAAAYAVLRQRLVTGQSAAFGWLQSQYDSGVAAPEWSDVLARM
jgi:hypothetical protein